MHSTAHAHSFRTSLIVIFIVFVIATPISLFHFQSSTLFLSHPTENVTLSETDAKGGAIHQLIMSDQIEADGSIRRGTASIPTLANEIYLTAHISSKTKSNDATAILTRLKNGAVMGPVLGKSVSQTNPIKTFSFTRDPDVAWPVGEYEITITLETGASKKIKFNIA